MGRSCPGFLDRYGIWNNGFDCSSPRVCCGPDTDRYCCIPSSILTSSLTSSTSSPTTATTTTYYPYEDFDSYQIPSFNNLFSEKWFFIRMCSIGICFAILFLLFVIFYLCLISIRHLKRRKNMPIIQVPPPSTSSFSSEPKRFVSNRISTISNASSDVKSRYTDASIVLTTPLNRYPIANSRNSTASSSCSSYYLYPNEFEYLCK